MVASARGTSIRAMGRALLVSFGLHACALALIPALAWLPTPESTVETVTFTHVAHIEIVPRTRRPQPRPMAPHHRSAVVISEAERVELARVSHRPVASPPPSSVYRVSSAPVVAAAPRPGHGTAPVVSAPQASATPAPREVSSIVGRNVGGTLPFGAEQPDPVLDPGVRKELAALGVHVTLVVTVGDNGKTKSVEFQPAVDPPTQTRIEALLADASWDPAVCGGGISCEGRATIRL